MSTLKVATRDKLRTVSTPTVATALFKRGFRNQAIYNRRTSLLIGPALVDVVGRKPR